MDYFSGLTFSLGGSNPAHLVWHRHVPTYYGIQYNYAGSLRLRIDGKFDASMEGPCAFISHPGSFFEYGSADGKPRHHNFVCFFGPRVQEFIKGGLLDVSLERPLLRISRPQLFLQLINELAAAINGRAGGSLSHSRMALLLEDLLLQLREGEREMRAGEKSSDVAARLRSLLASIERNPEKDWDFAAEAGKLSVTPAHFRRLFRHLTGLPPKRHLLRQRLRLAAGLLADGAEPLSEIGLKTGIGEEYYFSRLFKRRYSISPSKYRKEFAGHREFSSSSFEKEGVS